MTFPRRLAVVLLAGILVLGVAACSDDSDLPDDSAVSGTSSAADSSEVLLALADEVIVPAYETLVSDLETLTSSVTELCETPSASSLAAAQEAWRTTAVSWQGTRGGAVGPSMERRLMADVAFRARPDPVEDLIAGDEPIDTSALADKGSTFRGISLVEHLLFDPASAAALITPEGARRCSFIADVLPISTDAVGVVLDDWSTYRTTLAEGPEGDPLASVDEVTNQVIACLTAIDDNGIRDLAMAETLDDALSTRRDGPGGYVMAEYRALLASVAAVVEGGLGDLVEARSSETATRLTNLLDEAVAAVEPLADSVDAAYTEQHDQLVAASEAVAALKVLMTTEVASQLGITVRFSDADGDS